MSEAKLQTKIIKWLESKNCYVIKIIAANKSGIHDIVGCLPNGRFFSVEVKYGSNTPSKLQEYNCQLIKKNKGLTMVAWDLESVIAKFQPELVT